MTHAQHLKKYAHVDAMSYLATLYWMERQHNRGLKQKKCDTCGLFAIWYRPKKTEPPHTEEEDRYV